MSDGFLVKIYVLYTVLFICHSLDLCCDMIVFSLLLLLRKAISRDVSTLCISTITIHYIIIVDFYNPLLLVTFCDMAECTYTTCTTIPLSM